MKKIFMAAAVALLGICAFAKDFTLSIGAGTYWLAKNKPRVAVWITDENNNYLRTLYVSPAATPAEKAERAKSLYTWNAVAGTSATQKMDKGNALYKIDAVTTSTMKGGTFFDTSFPCAAGKKYIVWGEVNGTGDYNNYYTQSVRPGDGQPSVIYKGIMTNETTEEILMALDGIATLDAKGKPVYGKADKITTANEIVKLIALDFKKK